MRSDFATVRLDAFLPPLRRPACQDEARSVIAARLRSLNPSTQRATARQTSLFERSLVGRGGFEPPKALGRQIYSLLHLTALQPPRPREHAHPLPFPVELAEGFEPTTR